MCREVWSASDFDATLRSPPLAPVPPARPSLAGAVRAPPAAGPPAVPAHRGRRRRRPPPGHCRGPGVGQLGVGRRLRHRLAHNGPAPGRVGRIRRGPPPPGERGPDDAVLLRRRAGDQAGAGHRRVAGMADGGPARHRRRRGDGGARPRLPGGDRRGTGWTGLGRPDGHRHRLRHRRGRPAGATGARLAQAVPAHPGHRRRPGRHRGHRRLLRRGDLLPGVVGGRVAGGSHGWTTDGGGGVAAGLRAAGSGCVAGRLRVGRPRHHRRSHPRLVGSGPAPGRRGYGPGMGVRPLGRAFPGRAQDHGRPGQVGRVGGGAARAPPPPAHQLRHRPPVRPGQRRHRAHRRRPRRPRARPGSRWARGWGWWWASWWG